MAHQDFLGHHEHSSFLPAFAAVTSFDLDVRDDLDVQDESLLGLYKVEEHYQDYILEVFGQSYLGLDSQGLAFQFACSCTLFLMVHPCPFLLGPFLLAQDAFGPLVPLSGTCC